MPHKTLNSKKVTLKHRALFLIRFGAHAFNHRLFRYTIEMEERTKIAYDLDESEYIIVGNRVYLAKKVKMISAYKTKNASSKFFFANRNN